MIKQHPILGSTSIDKLLFLGRIGTTERDQITAFIQNDGPVIFNTDTGTLQYYSNGSWVDLSNLSSFNTITWFVPTAAFGTSEINVVGERRVISAGETGDYATDFGAGGHYVSILVNTIVGGGDIIITGTTISDLTSVPTTGVNETITVDTSANQYYQTANRWLEVENIDVSDTTTIDYDVLTLDHLGIANNDYTITGYRAEFLTNAVNADISIVIDKIQNDGGKKSSIVPIENMGFNTSVGGGQYYDGIRTGPDDRSFTMTAQLMAANNMVILKNLDYNSFFSSDENKISGSSENEGIIIKLLGSPTGGISSIESASITLYCSLGE